METNQKANFALLLYAVGIIIGGIAVGGATYVKEWGAGGYVAAAVLCVSGVVILVKKLQGAAAYVSLTCPSCGTEQTWAEEAFAKGRVAPCQKCFRYLERAADGTPALVGDDRVAPTPTFEAPFPRTDLNWNNACVHCGQPATAVEEVKGSVRKIGALGNKRITRTINVPVCAQHREQQAVHLISAGVLPGDESFSLQFRSYAQCLAFRLGNPTETKVRGNLTFHRG